MSERPPERKEKTESNLSVPMSDVVRFVRQLSHDLRNHLNAAELQSAFISEIATDPEVKDEVKRLRAMLSEMGGSLQTLTTSVAPVNLTTIRYEAAAFMEDLRQKLASKFPEESKMVEWTIDDAGNDSLDIDPQILQPAFLELFANAFQHERGSGSIRARTEVKDAGFVFTLDEPKTAFSAQTENWGREPFAKLKHGHYGLGLARVCSIIEAHQGQLRARYDSPSSSLVTQIVLPLSSGE